MATTRLGLSATPRSPYGSFAGKATEVIDINFLDHQIVTASKVPNFTEVSYITNILTVNDNNRALTVLDL